MKYGHILNYVARTPWAIAESKMQAILSVLAFRAAGGEFTHEEIAATLASTTAPASAPSGRGVAIVPLRGTICHRIGSMDESSGGISAERFARMFSQAMADDSVGTVVIDCDSPGGTVDGVLEAADTVFEARGRKPIIAVANGMMASAAYWIASQADEIAAVPSLLSDNIGSIGVYTVHADLSEHLAKEGIKVTIVRSGTKKFSRNPFEPLSEDEVARLQERCDSIYQAFLKAVARGRNVSVAQVRDTFGQGLAFPSKEAKSIGMIDRLATMDDVIGRAMNRRGRSQVGGGARAEASDLDAPALAVEEPVGDEPLAVAAATPAPQDPDQPEPAAAVPPVVAARGVRTQLAERILGH